MNRYMYWQSAGGNTRVYLLETFIIIIICCHNCLPIIVCYLCRYMLYGTVGCYVGNFFVGALAYADDIVLLAPSASAMRRMLCVVIDMLQIIILYLMLANLSVYISLQRVIIETTRRHTNILCV